MIHFKHEQQTDTLLEINMCIDDKSIGYLYLSKIYDSLNDIFYFKLDVITIYNLYRGKGYFNIFMKYFLRWFKNFNNDDLNLKLIAEPFGNEKSLTKAQLIKQYKKFGFVQQPKHRDVMYLKN